MASKIIPENPSNRRSIESLHEHALVVLNELGEEQGKAYAVASAGRAFVGDGAVTKNHLFSVIETLCGNAILTNSLRKLIAEIAERAGSTWVEEVAHV